MEDVGDIWKDAGISCKTYAEFRDMVTKGHCDEGNHLYKYHNHGQGAKVEDFDGKKTYAQYTYVCKSHGDMNRKGDNCCIAEVTQLNCKIRPYLHYLCRYNV